MIILRQRDYSKISEGIKNIGGKTKTALKRVAKFARKHPGAVFAGGVAGGLAGGLAAKAYHDGYI